jgi:inorganic pyrophosphatase
VADSLIKRPTLTQVLYTTSEEVCETCVNFRSEINTCNLLSDGQQDAKVSSKGHCILWSNKQQKIEKLKDPSESFDKKELKTGTEHELEHTNDPKVAQQIAVDHLKEDSEYYTKLKQIEEIDKSFISEHFDYFEVGQTTDLVWKSLKSDGKVKRTIKFQGLTIGIETDKGEYRHWYDSSTRTTGKTKMNYPYGFIKRTEGADGDSVDVYVGPDDESTKVFVVHQLKAPKFTQYGEDKVMLGFISPREAKSAYLEHYDNPKYFGEMTETTIDAFKRMLSLDGPKTRVVKKSFIPGMPMMPGMMGPPPIDVETFDGVRAILSRIGNSKDAELMQIASEIWGPGCNFQGQTPDQAREEIIGFLLDQQDLLGVAQNIPPLQEDTGIMQTDNSNSGYPVSDQNQELTGNAQTLESTDGSLNNSSTLDSSQNQPNQALKPTV